MSACYSVVSSWLNCWEAFSPLDLREFTTGYSIEDCLNSHPDHLSSYFRSKFHIFDATVIVAAFVLDVLLRGPLEEAGSLVVVLRLWRVFKIIEEFSTGAEDSMAELYEKIADLEREREDVRKENQELRSRTRNRSNDTDVNAAEDTDGHAG